MTDRERFERWILSVNANDGHTIERIEPGEYRSAVTECAWEAWQAATAATARECADIAEQLAKEREGWAQAMRDGALYANEAIRARFPMAGEG
jgi:hypothetical protein